MSETTVTNVQREGSDFTAADPTIPFRVVGSFEYVNAIRDLDKLIALSTPQEIEVYDKLLEHHPQFSFYSGMEIQGGLPPEWKPANPAEQTQFESQYRKRGLAWMLALAKVEVGATLAAYTSSRQPFQNFPPTPFDGEQFLALLLEDSIAHVRALEQEPLFKHVLRDATADNETLAYLRRIKLIRNMLDCLKDGGGRDMAALVRSTEEKLTAAQAALVEIVTATIAAREQVTQKTFDTKGKVVASEHAACQELVKSLQ